MNFLILLGCLWAAAHLRVLRRDRTFLAVLFGAALPAAFVFGADPPALIARLPFLGNIGHIANAFSCALIIHLLVIAAFGLRALWDCAGKKGASAEERIALILLVLLAAIFIGHTHARGMKMSAFFLAYAPAILVALALMPRVARGLRAGPSTGHLILGALCLFLLHFRHGLWLGTKFDSYTANPKTRIDLAALSPAVAKLRAMIRHDGEPVRVAGINGVLSPGFNTVLGLDHLAGIDALISPWQRALLEKSSLRLDWGWTCYLPRDSFPRTQIFGDLWNTRWYLSEPAETPRSVNGLTPVKSLDLDILASPGAWPRAFFTDRLAECASLDNFIALLGTADGRPFAALVPEKNSDAPPAPPESLDGRTVVPASDYHVTENSTAFIIRAPAPGVAVLGDSFEPGNWRVTLDGRPAECFRVNHAFLGVAIPAAGEHSLRFLYWPRVLTPALWISLAGVLGMFGTAAIFSRRERASAAAVMQRR